MALPTYDPTQFTDPTIRAEHADQINQIERERAQAQREQERQQREQEQAQKEAQRQQEQAATEQRRAQAAAQKEALTQANVQAETDFKKAGRPYYKSEDGRIVPEQDDATYAAEQEKKRAQAAQEIQYKQEGRKFTKNSLTGALVPLETDEALASRRATEAEGIRRDSITKQMQAIAAEGGMAPKPLSITERTKAEKALRTAKQDAISGLTPLLAQRSKEVSNGNDWVPFNESPTDTAKLAQERLTRLSQPEAELDDADLADLEANESTKPIAAQLKVLRGTLSADDEAKKAQESTRQRLAELTLRRDAPDKWEALQRQRQQSLSGDALQTHLANTEGDLRTRMEDFQARSTALSQEAQGFGAEQEAFRSENARAIEKGVPAGELVNIRRPDGTTEPWHRPLAEKYFETQAKAEAWHGDPANRQRITALEQEAKELEREQTIYQEGVAQSQQQQATTQKVNRDRLRFTPGYEGAALEMDSIDAETQQRMGALQQQYPQGVPPEAVQAIQEEMANRQQVAQQMAAQRSAAVASAYDGVKTVQAEMRAADPKTADYSGPWFAARDNLATALGIPKQEATRLLNDQEAMDWTQSTTDVGRPGDANDPLSKALSGAAKVLTFGAHKSDTPSGGEPYRILSNGGLIVNPVFLSQPAQYQKVVEGSTASPEAKAAALAAMPDQRRLWGQQALETFEAYDASGFANWSGSKATDPVEKAIAYADHLRATNGPISRLLDQVLRRSATGVMQLGSQVLGLGALVTGSETLAQGASSIDRYANASRGMQEYIGANDSFLNRAVGQVAEIVPSTGISLGGGLAARAGVIGLTRTGVGIRLLGMMSKSLRTAKTPAEAAKAMQGIMQTSALTGAAVAGGGQTAGAQFAETYAALREQGLSHTEAVDGSRMPALISGAVTTMLTLGFGATGAESLLKNPAAAQATFSKRLPAILKGITKGAISELPEELTDELFSQMSAEVAKNPNVRIQDVLSQFIEHLPELATAVAVVGGAGGGLQSYRETAASQPGQSQPDPALAAGTMPAAPPSPANLPETIAAAEAQIDSLQLPESTPEQLAITQDTARTLLYVAQGQINDLPDAELALIGVGRNAKGELENVKSTDGQPPRVKIENGQPIITQPALDNLSSLLPAVRNAIPMDESTMRQRLAVGRSSRILEASDQTTPKASAGGANSTATQSPGSTEQDANTSTNATADEAQITRAAELSTHLQDLGLPADQAQDVATAMVARRGIVGESYIEQVVSKDFKEDLKALGMTGSLDSRKAAENPLKAPADLADRLQKLSPRAATASRQTSDSPSLSSSVVEPKTAANGTSGTTAAPPVMGGGGPVQGASSAPPAGGAPAPVPSVTESADYVTARREAIAGTPVEQRKHVVKLLGALDKALTRYGPAFTKVKFVKQSTEGLNVSGGGMLVTRSGKGDISLEVNLSQWVKNHSHVDKAADKVALAEVEEEFIHRAAAGIFSDTEMESFWQGLPAEIQSRVYQGYHAVDIADGRLPKAPPAKLPEGQPIVLAHEFLRMLVQDSSFHGRVSEVVAADPALGERIIGFLTRLVDSLRRLIDAAPTSTRVTIREYEGKLTKEVNRLRKALPDPLKAKQEAPNFAGEADNRKAVVASGSEATPSGDFKPALGSLGTAYTDGNDAIEYRWAVVEANSANISNRDDGTINPGYPQELQPRDRTSAGSESQVNDISKNLLLERLSASSGVGDGAPILGPDGVVESGNGRMMGARRAYAQRNAASSSYRDALMRRASEFGLDSKAIEGMKQPVLVRVRQTQVDRVAFVLAANVSTIAPKREIETAKADAKQIVPDLFENFIPSEDGEIFTAANADFIRGFISAIIPPAERPAIIDARGNLSQTGLRRIRNALFVHAYGDSPESLNALARLTESLNASGTNIVTALIAAAPRFAEQKARQDSGALYPLSITEDLAQSIQTLQDLRNRGEKVADWLAQDRIPGIGDDPTPLQKSLIEFLDTNASRPRQILAALTRYSSAVDAAGDPKQGNLFGDTRPTREELWALAAQPPASTTPLPAGSRAVNLTPETALKLYRRLKTIERDQGTLSGTQAQTLERAERVLGQTFMFEFSGWQSPGMQSRYELSADFGNGPDRQTETNASQLTLFTSSKKLDITEFDDVLQKKADVAAKMLAELTPAFRAEVERSLLTGQPPKYPGLDKAMPSPNLDRESRIVEARFFQRIAQNPGAAMAAYLKLAREDFGSPRYLNADLARSVLPEYAAPENSWFRTVFDSATIAPAGFITLGLLYPRFLTQRKNKNLNQVVLLAGGPSSGKTTVAQNQMRPALDKAVAIVDSVMGSVGGSNYLINTALNAGIRPVVAFIYRPFEHAALHALKRLVKTGRPVNVEATSRLHYEAQKTFFALEAQHRAEVMFRVYANDGGLNEIRPVPLDFLRNQAYYLYDDSPANLAGSYGRIVESEFQKGGLSPSQYGAARWGRVAGRDRHEIEQEADRRGSQDGTADSAAQGLVDLPGSSRRRQQRDDGPDLFASFNNNLALNDLLTPAQQEAKQQQAQQLDLFSTATDENRSDRSPNRPRGSRRPASGEPQSGDQSGQASGNLGELFPQPPAQQPAGSTVPAGQSGVSGRSGRGQPGAGADNADAGGTLALGDANPAPGVPALPRGGGRAPAQPRAPRTASVVPQRQRPAPESPERNYQGYPGIPSGASAKIRANLDAIALLKQLETKGRNPTAEEKETLARYVGWGAFKEAFNKANAEAYESNWMNRPKHVQSQYMPDYLRSWVSNHYDRYLELRTIMSDEEFAGAARSTLNAHYTDPAIIRSMWDMARKLGFRGGAVLEPASGSGFFLAQQPQDLADASTWQAVELDDLTARLFSKLYPEASINEMLPNPSREVGGLGFERARIPDHSQDLIISNVPFFESGPPDARYPLQMNLHNYFFARALDKVKPGGLVMFITSASTMQNNIVQRKFLASKGDLVAAFRLPNNAFAANAGTEVTTDIIILRKPNGDGFQGENWTSLVEEGRQNVTFTQSAAQNADEFRRTVKAAGRVISETKNDAGKLVSVVDAPIMVNEYYATNPHHVLGQHALEGSMYRANEYTVKGTRGNLAKELTELAAALPRVVGEGTPPTLNRQGESIADGAEKAYSYVERDGLPWLVNPDRTLAKPDWQADPKTVRVWQSWRGLAAAVSDLVRAENNPQSSDASLAAKRATLNQRYDDHIARYGALSKRHPNPHRPFADDPDFPLTAALEDEVKSPDAANPKKVKYSYQKALIFRERIISPATPPESAETPDEALNHSLGWRSRIDVPWIAELLGIDEAGATAQLLALPRVFTDPASGMLETSDRYLSGNVRQKLAEAEAALPVNPQMAKNVEALRAAQPAHVPIGGLPVNLGERWIPAEVYQQFATEVLGVSSPQFRYISAANQWRVDGYGSNAEFRTEDVAPVSVLDDVMNSREVQVWRGSAKERTLDITATATAKALAAKIQRAFEEYVRTSETLIGDKPVWQTVEDVFNATQNNFVVPQYSGEHLAFPGLSTDVYRTKHRRAVIARFLAERHGMMAHGVGSGKTFNQIVLAQEMRRLGLAKRPMIVVQNSTLGQFAASYRRAYPNAKILVGDDTTFEKSRRKQFVSRVVTGDYDAIILPHSQFSKIPHKPEVLRSYLADQVSELEDLIELEKANKGTSVRDMEGMKLRLEQRREQMLDRLAAQQDNTLFWEDLGIDALIVDEAHKFKSVPIITRKSRIKGIPAGVDSQAGVGMLLKSRSVQARNGGKNVFLATGTPIKNTMAEAYIMMMLASPHVLSQYQINNFDDFANTYGREVSSTEISWGTNPKVETRFAKFIKGQQLITLIRTSFDVAMGNEKLGLKVPQIKGGSPEMLILPASGPMKDFNTFVRQVAQKFAGLSATKREEMEAGAVPIMTLQAGIAAALDTRLISPTSADQPDSKVNEAVRRVVEIWKAGKDRRSTQAIFSDLQKPFDLSYLWKFANATQIPTPFLAGDGEAKSGFNLFDDVKRKLVAAGIPASEIVIVGANVSKEKRGEIFDKVDAGDFRIILGSTETIGVGANFQTRLKAVHHLMPPRDFTPAMMEQRNGRIIRQGNLHYDWNEQVEIINYGVEGTMDSAIYGTLARKQRFITQILMGENISTEFDDPADPIAINMAEMAARTMGDPDFVRRVELEKVLNEMRAERQGFLNELASKRRRLSLDRRYVDQGGPAKLAELDEVSERYAKLFERTSPPPEDVTPEAAADKPVYRFGGRTVDTAAKEGSKILEPLDLWLAEQSVILKRSGRSAMDSIVEVNGIPVPVEIHQGIADQSTPGAIKPKGYNSITFTGSRGLLNALRSLPEDIAWAVKSTRLQLDQARTGIQSIESAIAKTGQYERESEFLAAEEELRQVDARLAAKAKQAQESTAAPVPLATSPKSVNSGGDEQRDNTSVVDRWTSGTTQIRGSRVTREQGQAISDGWKARLRAVPPGHELSGRGPALEWDGPAEVLVQRLSAAFPDVPVLSAEQWSDLRSLPVIGEGAEAAVHHDTDGDVVYKVLQNGRMGPSAGIWPDVGWTDQGRLDWRYEQAVRPRHLGVRLAVLNAMGGTPTELAGIGPEGHLILKQPLSPDATLEQHRLYEPNGRGSRYQTQIIEALDNARSAAGLVELPRRMVYEDLRTYLVVIDGRPWMVFDLLSQDNYVADNQHKARINDPVIGQVTPNLIRRIPGLADIVRQAAQEATRLGDRSLRLFTSSKAVVATPTDSQTDTTASPLAKAGWNHLDRALSGKVAAHTRWAKDSAGETVAGWLQGISPAGAAWLQRQAKLIKRELVPDSVMPRELAAKKREMEIKTAMQSERAMDLVRALSGTPKFSDISYPAEFAENPVWRKRLYLAMTGEAPMSALPPSMQALAKRLRAMLEDIGREAVKQGRMSTDTFNALTEHYMPHFYKEDVLREKSLFQRFRLGIKDIFAQRTTAWHIVDNDHKDASGEPRLVSWDRNQWRFRNAEHRDAFYEDFLLQQALEIITNRGRATRNLTLADLRAPSKLPEEVRGRLKEITLNLRRRYQRRKPLTYEEQEKAGLIMDPVYAIARYAAQMSHDNNLAEWFNFVAANPAWVSATASPGFTEIPDNPRFGRLAGKFVTEDISRQILDLVESPNQALQIYDTLLNWWKTGKTVLNPGTHVRNVLGNLFFSQLAGASIWNPGNLPYYRQSIQALRNGGKDLIEAYEMGVLGADFVSAELRQTLRQLLPEPGTIQEGKESALMGIGKVIGQYIPQVLKNPVHKAYNQIAALYQAEDEVFKLATYLKAKGMGLSPEQARDHVRQWYPYFDKGSSGTLKAIGRTAMPFLGFYRESIRIFGEALKHRPISLAAGLSVPSILTFLSAMVLGLDDDDLDQVRKDMRGKAGKLLGPTPLEGMPLFSFLLPTRSGSGAIQQIDISAVHPFVDFLGNRVESQGGDWYQDTWRAMLAAGPLGSLVYSQMTGRDTFGDRTFVEDNMSGMEKLGARADNVAKTLLPPLAPFGTGAATLLNAGTRTTNKTLEMRDPVQAVTRAVVGVDVRNATPDLYRIADDWRKANGLPMSEGMDSGSTPVSRARKALFATLAQPEPNLKAIRNITARLKEMGSPVSDANDIRKLLFYRNPLMIIRGQENQQRFRASLQGLERDALEASLREFADISRRAPGLIRQAQALGQ